MRKGDNSNKKMSTHIHNIAMKNLISTFQEDKTEIDKPGQNPGLCLSFQLPALPRGPKLFVGIALSLPDNHYIIISLLDNHYIFFSLLHNHYIVFA